MAHKSPARRGRSTSLERLAPFEDDCVLVVGFVPSTRADDGDPLDVLVLMDAPVYPGCIVPSRLIGVIEAEQTEEGETERNDRLLAVAANSAAHRSLRQLSDLSQDLVAQIEHFFVSYNEMKGKRFEVNCAGLLRRIPRRRNSRTSYSHLRCGVKRPVA